MVAESPVLPSTSCSIAFKEWAAICAALAAGRQTILLRKGGIQEDPGGFQVQHRQFWLYPTKYHQESTALTADGAAYLQQVQQQLPAVGTVELRHIAVVEEMRDLETEAAAQALQGLHLWADQVWQQRFHYKRPGLRLLLVRVYEASVSHLLAETPEFSGCKSWVALPQPLPTGVLRPVLKDVDFAARVAELSSALRSA